MIAMQQNQSKMKSIFFSLLLQTAILSFFGSCIKRHECEEPNDVRNSEVLVAFKDKATGRYLYSEVNPMYNKDSLKVYDQNGSSLVILSQLDVIPNSITGRFYALSFGAIYNPQTDAAAFNGEVNKYFVVRYNATETDTIKTSFSVTKTKCGSVFTPLRVYHKGQLLDSVVNTTVSSITLIK
jgi:hypothetical protein